MAAARIDRDPIIIAAIATGATQQQAADLAGCHVRTVRRRLVIPEVRQALNDERARLAAELADALTGTVGATIARLRSIAAQGNDRDAIGAGRVLLAEARAWRDASWTSEQIEQIKDELAQRRRAR